MRRDEGILLRYHGWTYDLNGRLTALRERRDFPGLETSQLGLSQVRCERFGNWIFLNEDPHAETLLESLGPIPGRWENLALASTRHITSSWSRTT